MSNVSSNLIASMFKFAGALKESFPTEWEKVETAYTQGDALGRTLAQIPGDSDNNEREKELENFPVQESANNKHISYEGLDRYLLSVLTSDAKKDVIRNRADNGLKNYHNINVLSEMVEAHPLAKFITQKKPLFAEDFISIVASNFADLANLRKLSDEKTISGVLEASQGPSHGDYVWTRDMAAVALGKLKIKQTDFAQTIAIRLLEAYVNPSQRKRIDDLIENGNNGLWETLNANEFIPHTRFKVETIKDGEKIENFKLVDCDEDWGMQQLDAYGYFLQLVTKLAQEDKDFKLGQIEDGLREQFADDPIYKDKKPESTVVALARMLVAINYWEKADAGAWEYPSHKQRASSIAAVIAGLQNLKNLIQTGKSSLYIGDGQAEATEKFVTEVLDKGINEGRKFLVKRIPDQAGAFALELDPNDPATNNLNPAADNEYKIRHKEREKDAALLFALTIADPELIGLTENQEQAILKTVYDLMGEVGFKRFKTDEYMGKNWTTVKSNESDHGEHANNTTDDYKAAEWSFFDPYLSSYFYQKFLKSDGEDLESYLKADRHARRALAQITKTNYKFYRPEYKKGEEVVPAQEIEVPAGEVTEHYWVNDRDLHTGEPDGQGERWMVGENYRLNWTKIAIQEMMHYGSEASKVFKEKYPNKWEQFDIVGLSLSSLGKEKSVSRRAVA